MGKGFFLSFFLIFVLLGSFFVNVSFVFADGEGWLSGWTYRKSHSITGSSGVGTDYDMKVFVDYGSGSDSGNTVYVDGNCSSDFSDIRFTDNDGSTVLDYWMENYTDSDVGVFWYNVNDDLGSNQVIYVYYGNDEASYIGVIADVFIMGDDFDDGDYTGWTVHSGTSGSVSGGIWSITGHYNGGNTYISSPTFTARSDYRVGGMMKMTEVSYGVLLFGASDGVGSSSANRNTGFGWVNTDHYSVYNDGVWDQYSDNLIDNIYHRFLILNEDSGVNSADYQGNDGTVDSDYQYGSGTETDIDRLYIAISDDYNTGCYFDWFFLTSYDSGVVDSTWGSLEITSQDYFPQWVLGWGDNGVTQVGEDVDLFCYWTDDFNLTTLYVEHNNTGTFTNVSRSIESVNQSWSNLTLTLNYTSGNVIGFRFLAMDNASQWNSTNYLYITTTAMYVTWCVNSGGSFYVDGTLRSNGTQLGYNYNQSLSLMGVPSNSSYVFSKFDSSGVDATVNPATWFTAGNDTVWCLFAEAGSGDSFRFVNRNSLFFVFAIVSMVLLVIVVIVFKNRR